MKYRDLVEDYKQRGEQIRKLKDELESEINNYKELDSVHCNCNPKSVIDIKNSYLAERKKILGDNVKPISDTDLNKLKELSEKYKKDIGDENIYLGIRVFGQAKTEINRKLCKSARTIRKLEKQIYDYSRKNMHLHIALSLFRGTPLNKILSPSTRKKIRPESVYEFLESITEY